MTEENESEHALEPAEAATPESSGGDESNDHSSEGSSDGDGGRPGRRGGGLLAWLAVLLAVAALGLASHPYWPGASGGAAGTPAAPTAGELDALEQRLDEIARAGEESASEESVRAVEEIARDNSDSIDALGNELDTLVERIDGIEPVAASASERIDRIARRVEQLEGQTNTGLGGIRTRVEELESRVGRELERFELRLSEFNSNREQSDRDRAARARLVEIDSLLAIAQDQLAVLGNAAVARRAWQRALERMTALEGPRYARLKELARSEFERLEEFRPVDVTGTVERLYDIAGAVPDWPGRSAGAGEQAQSEAGADPGWRARLGAIFDSLVEVESVDRGFLAPVELDLARQQVGTTLQTAGLALARGEPTLAGRLVGEAHARAERIFDASDPDVAEALAWLDGLELEDRAATPPALGRSREEIAQLLGGLE